MSSFAGGALPRRRFLQLGGITAAGLTATALTGCASLTGASEGSVRVSLPGTGSAGSVWRPVIERRGLNRNGLPLRWVTGQPGQLQTQFTSGTVDISTFGALGAAIAALNGVDVVLAGPGLLNHIKWLVRADSPYARPEDLRGRKVATQESTSDTYRQAQLIYAITGRDFKTEFDLVTTSPTAAQALFERGDVDGVLVGEPTASRIVGQGARQIGTMQRQWREAIDEDEPLITIGQSVRLSWIRDHRDDGFAALDLLAKANETISRDPRVLTQIAADLGLRPDEKKAADSLPARLGGIYPYTWDEKAWKNIERQIDLAVKHGVLKRKPGESVILRGRDDA